jgi:ABC-type transport system involved in multi-copper enzyme maturation permease subunit
MFSQLSGILFLVLLALAALPWVWSIDPDELKAQLRRPRVWTGIGGAIIGLHVIIRIMGKLAMQDPERLQVAGRLYGSVLQLFLLADFFVLAFVVLLTCWPRGGAVALAAFREGIRQPLFWLLAGISLFLMLISVILPYFTFGDDYKMMKQIGFDIILLFTTLFAVLTASMSISDEIEGRTAITLMSKPLSRRQFLLGKFAGILLASLALAGLTGWSFNWALYVKPMIDREDAIDPLQAEIQPALVAGVQALAPDRHAQFFLEGTAGWFGASLALLPGQVISCCQVMLFLAIAAALATRLPIVVNLLTCLFVFFLGNLAPYLVQLSQHLQRQYPGGGKGLVGAALDLAHFTARLLDTILPALEYFGLGAAIVRDQPLPLGPYALHVVFVAGYAVLYTAIALLLGLILFEDRDLA